MKRVIIVGSPRANGRSAHLAEMLFEANIDERPEDELYLVPISEIDVGPCIGCGACKKLSPVTFLDADGNEFTEERNRCIFDDDMQTLYDLLDEADLLTIVCPVYFSGTPGPMKCLLDRLQPYFWPYCANGPRLPKRPLELHVIGEGGDPHGYAPLVSEVKGPTALAGFRLERIFDWVGKISPEGEILEEAEEIELATVMSALASLPGAADGSRATANANEAQTGASAAATGKAVTGAKDVVDAYAERTADQQPVVEQAKPYAERPKLSFSGASDKAPSKAQGQPRGKSASQSHGKSQGKSAGQSNSKSQSKASAKAQSGSQSKASAKAQSGSQGKSQGKAQAQSKGKTQGQPRGKQQTQNQSRGKSQAQGQARGKSQTEGRGQAAKQSRGRSGGKGGRRG